MKDETHRRPLGGVLFGRGLASARWIDYGFIAVFVILLVVAAVSSEFFFSQTNLTNIARQMVTTGLISLGMLVVILTGGIDLSVGAVVALAGIMAAGLQADLPLALAVLLALAVGAAAGTVNGLLVARFRLAPFIVTLATLSAFRGLVYVYSDTPITPDDPSFRTVLGGGFVGPIPVPVIIMLVCYAAVWLFIGRTSPGRAIVAIGGNAEAVRLAGVNVRRHVVTAYVLSGFFSALAGVLLVSRLGIAQPNVGVGYELDAIAACVIGGAILGGGGGSVVGVLGGVLTLGLIDNLLNLFNVQSYYQQILKGVIIVVAVLARRATKAKEF
ncbi:MAG TPA: ABC transporter permease [Actinomycetota bacterium]|nr:ABC transporter permease [Actinomycetota bacterium]